MNVNGGDARFSRPNGIGGIEKEILLLRDRVVHFIRPNKYLDHQDVGSSGSRRHAGIFCDTLLQKGHSEIGEGPRLGKLALRRLKRGNRLYRSRLMREKKES